MSEPEQRECPTCASAYRMFSKRGDYCLDPLHGKIMRVFYQVDLLKAEIARFRRQSGVMADIDLRDYEVRK